MSEVGLSKHELDTPILWTDLDRLERNIASLAAHFKAAGVDWRPHTKGVKIPAIAHKAIAAGAIGVTCAKLGEAEVMAAAGIQDILVANQVVGPIKITRLVNLSRYADVKVSVDNPRNVREIGAAAHARGVEVSILVEVDVGMHRVGVTAGQATLELARLVHETPGVRLRGLMGYEGHALEHPEPERKRQAIELAITLLTDSALLCREAGLPIEIVSGGGSGTYEVTPFLPHMTEIQAGGGMFCDASYQHWGVKLEPTLFVRTMVTSRPTLERVTTDAGWKTLPLFFRAPQPLGLPPIKSQRASAEHGVIVLEEPNETIEIGDCFDFVVGYGDATVVLHNQMYGLRDEIVEVVWDIQGRGKLR